MTYQTKEIRKFLDELSAPNIAVIGLVGVGKSSLINAVFGERTAPVGAGKAITTEYTKYSPKICTGDSTLKLPVNLYDSPGYEAGREESVFVKKTFDFLEKKSRQGKEEQIHLVWYVVSAPGARLKQFDIDIIEEINKQHIPAIIVLSQCDRASPEEKSRLREVIEETKFSKVYETVEVAASPLILSAGNDPRTICEPFGINEILDRTEALLPEIYSEALIVSQVVAVKEKRQVAWKRVENATVGCFSIGTTPIPLSAPSAAIGALVYMYRQIMIIYGYKHDLIIGISAGITVGGFITLFLDASLDLFSLVLPGISVLTGTTAAIFTFSSGIAFIKACERLAINKVRGSDDEIKEQLRKFFKEEFQRISSEQIEFSQENYRDDLRRVKQRFIDDEI